MKIREYEFNGTPEEFIRIASVLRGSQGQPQEGSSTESVKPLELVETVSAASGNFVTKQQAMKILTRRKLSSYMDGFLGELSRNPDQWIKSDHLRQVIGFTGDDGADKFRGLLGAFGRRVTHDVGKGVDFFEHRWNYEESQKEWKLPASVKQAIEELRWYR